MLVSLARRWLPVLAWAGVIFALSSVPSLGTELGAGDAILRALGHLAEFAVLGALLVRAIGAVPPSFVVGVLYAVSDEVHQTWVDGRRGTALDVVVDAAGVALGILAWTTLRTRRAVA